ncbi:MAG: 16S rRNA (guanine(966)-N(2))-methyltransferase RsmD [Candidatus Izimaplasma sp.]|nr:16S rRNA (guanine(966)-N(2))-methyltransferase RsmD [Candidatus Izimaplasma bacterium]
MRVISGKYRSRKLKRVASNSTRETKDRIKEGIFNSIQFDLADAVVLDLFAGSGALGIEALSRGAKRCDFVDQSRDAIAVIKDNLEMLKLTSVTSVHLQDYDVFLKTCEQPYDIILLDPPYRTFDLNQLIQFIEQNKLLTQVGKIVVLMHKTEVLNPKEYGIINYQTKIKGITKTVLLKWSD